MSTWKKYRLSDVVNIIGGGTPKRSAREYWNGVIPWLSVVDFNSDSRFVSKTVEKITELGLQKSSTKLLNAGEIIISARGTVGCLAQLTEPMAFNQSCYGLAGKPDFILNDFLYYLLKEKVSELKQNAHGAVFDTITRDTFSLIEISIPNLNKQYRILNVLGAIDKKIENNQRTNETLEQIAQALFKSWFVDFDPVKAKIGALNSLSPWERAGVRAKELAELAAMGVISAKTPKQLAELKQSQPDDYAQLAETAALFPSAMQESELGEIPEGWDVSSIEKSFKVIMGQSPKGDTYNEDGKGALFYQGRAEFGWRFPSPRLYTTDPKRMANKGDVLMSVRAPVGDLNIALDDCCVGRGLCSLQHSSGSTTFTYYLLKQLQSKFNTFNGEGTVFGSINQKDLKSIQYISPDDKVIAAYKYLMEPLDQKIEILSIENNTLSSIRDSLLPRLLSGELKLQDSLNRKRQQHD